MSKKNNTTIKKNVLEAEKLSKAIKEGTKRHLSAMMNEAINKIIAESEEEDEDSYEVEDVDTEVENDETSGEEKGEDTEVKDAETEEADETEEESDETEDAEVEDTEDTDMPDVEDYKVGDDTYDLMGEKDPNKYIKIFNKLDDGDNVIIRRNEEGEIEMVDDNTGAEYVIELDTEALADEEGGDFEEETEFEIEPDGEEFEGDDEFDIVDNSEEDFDTEDGFGEEEDFDAEYEFDGEGDDEIDYEDEEEEEFLTEDEINAFVTDYQKNVMSGLKNHETANKEATYSMDGGVPTGTERPYSGYKKETGDPFTGEVNEQEEPIEEGSMSTSSQSVAKTTHTPTSKPRADYARQVKKLVHAEGGYVNEDLARKIINKAKEIDKQNKLYEGAIKKIKNSLREAAILNVTLTQALKLMVENTTTMDEKKSIVERFKNVKTINESKTLYDTISRELKSNKSGDVILEHDFSVASTSLNETKMYKKELSNNPSINLMNRMDNLYK